MALGNDFPIETITPSFHEPHPAGSMVNDHCGECGSDWPIREKYLADEHHCCTCGAVIPAAK